MTVNQITSLFRLVGVVAAALSIGFLIEFGRSEGIRTGPLVQACLACLVSYLIPALWLRWRYWNEPRFAWLAIPTLGTILACLTVVLLPNGIAIWNRSTDGMFIANAAEALPRQLFNFVFFFVLISAISCLIIGFVQVLGLALLRMMKP
jgi:hypothetical protein